MGSRAELMQTTHIFLFLFFSLGGVLGEGGWQSREGKPLDQVTGGVGSKETAGITVRQGLGEWPGKPCW